MPIEEGLNKPAGRLYVAEFAQAVDRTPHTVKQWLAKGAMPRECLPRTDSRGWRYWLPSQVDATLDWIDRRRPQTPEKIAKLRAPRESEQGDGHWRNRDSVRARPEPEEWYVFYDRGESRSGPFEDKHTALQAAGLIEGDVVVAQDHSPSQTAP